MTRLGALFSGGKDSTYAAYAASKTHKVRCLITLIPESQDSYMFHFPNLRWTALQAKSMGLPQIVEHTKGEKETELDDLRLALSRAKREFDLEGICTGAIASVYQKGRVERICEEVGLECHSPLWGVDPEKHLRRLIDEEFTVSIVSVSALGLTEKWLGRTLDTGAVNELVELGRENKFNIALEGGEGETFVLDCPIFSERIEITSSTMHWGADSGYLEITGAKLLPKV